MRRGDQWPVSRATTWGALVDVPMAVLQHPVDQSGEPVSHGRNRRGRSHASTVTVRACSMLSLVNHRVAPFLWVSR